MAKAGNPSRLGTHAGVEGAATRSALRMTEALMKQQANAGHFTHPQ